MRVEANFPGHSLEMRSIANDCKLDHSLEMRSIANDCKLDHSLEMRSIANDCKLDHSKENNWTYIYGTCKVFLPVCIYEIFNPNVHDFRFDL